MSLFSRVRESLRGKNWSASVLVVLLGLSGCAVNENGLVPNHDASPSDASLGSGGRGIGGRGGTAGSGPFGSGGFTMGGSTATGGRASSGGGGGGGGGGKAGTGGAASGGAAVTGGRVGSGGAPGSGGAGADGSGGMTASTGGRQATGGGSGGAATGGMAGTGGAPATGGRGGPPGCGPSNCPNGCCDGNICVSNRTRLRCGNHGIACAPCAPCFQCTEMGACDVMPTSTWTLSCQSASVTATKPNGSPWDNSGPSGGGNSAAPDPFCEFQINQIGQRDSEVEVDTFMPSWNQDITPRNVRVTPNWLMSQAGSWSILVADYDVMNNEEICLIFPTLTAANFSTGTVAFSNNRSCTALTVQLACSSD